MVNRKHLEEFARSGISLQTVIEAGIKSITATEAYSLLGYNIASGGWAIPYHPLEEEEGEIIWQVKPDIPQKDKRGRARKYLLPIGKPPRLYIPPGLDIRQTDYVVVTEGVKKVLSATQSGIACIGLEGVWSFLRKEDTGSIPIEDLRYLERKTCYLCFDSDVMQKSQVRDALRDLTKLLEKQGCRALICSLPQSGREKKVGLDDFIVAGGDLSALMSEAISLPDWEMERMQEIQDTRIEEFLYEYEHPLPAITTGIPQLDSILGGLRRRNITAMAGLPGHGKTTAIIQNAVTAALRGHKVAIFSLEMEFGEFYSWAIANHQKLLRDDIFRGHIPAIDLRESAELLRAQARNLLVFAGADAPKTPKEIIRQAVALSPDLLIIDHHEEIHWGNKTEMRHEIRDFMVHLKHDVAQECNTAVVLVCQMNRAVERDFATARRMELPLEECWAPSPHHIAEGPAIEKGSQVVGFWCRPFILTNEEKHYNDFWFDLKKSRFGITGRHRFHIDPEKGVIT
jgi:KaiC/GvpD/RAD55 family RecA-like ATPase